MRENQSGTAGNLDDIRRRQGANALKAYFIRTAQADRAAAARLVNAGGLTFATLFLLAPEIGVFAFYGELSPRSRIALTLCAKILPETAPAGSPGELPDNDDEIRPVLRWMVVSGEDDDGLSDAFDQILDVSAALLTRGCGDILPVLVRIIFRRNRRRAYIHDMTFALFGAAEPSVLNHIARYLRSQNKRDVALARILLRNASGGQESASPRSYADYRAWMRENRPYLYFTGQGFQSACDPTPSGVDLGAKYLCRRITAARQPAEPLTEAESSRIEAFRSLNGPDRLLLANYSHRLHGRSPREWNRWMENTVEQQLKAAREREARHDRD